MNSTVEMWSFCVSIAGLSAYEDGTFTKQHQTEEREAPFRQIEGRIVALNLRTKTFLLKRPGIFFASTSFMLLPRVLVTWNQQAVALEELKVGHWVKVGYLHQDGQNLVHQVELQS